MIYSRLLSLALFVAASSCSVAPAPTGYEGHNMLVTHDVRDLVLPQPGVDSSKLVKADALVANVEQATDAQYWRSGHGRSLKWIEGGYILVKAQRGMQKKVTAFLEDHRSLLLEKK